MTSGPDGARPASSTTEVAERIAAAAPPLTDDQVRQLHPILAGLLDERPGTGASGEAT